MKLSFCTLFDVNYLERGLVLYDSLNEICSEFILYIVAMDDKCYSILKSLELKNADIIHIDDISYKQLAEAKKNRSHRAFCWTCSSWSLKYIFDTFNPEMCTYIDADEYFYSSPEELLVEFQESVENAAIVGHHFGVEKYARKMRENSGTYCVQFNTFKNNKAGRRILDDWCSDCANDCTDHVEKNNFGDQKYLDNWLERYGDVYVHKEVGLGIAPWNLYRFRRARNEYTDNPAYLYDTISRQNVKVYFIHFHSLMINDEYADISVFTRYGNHDRALVKEYYKKYIDLILRKRHLLKEEFPEYELKKIEDISSNKKIKKSVIEKMKTQGVRNYIFGAVKYRLYKRFDRISF